MKDTQFISKLTLHVTLKVVSRVLLESSATAEAALFKLSH